MTTFKFVSKAGGAKAALFLACICVLGVAACKGEKAETLSYNGEIINPVCFLKGAAPEGVSLVTCDNELGKDEYMMPEGGLETLENGMVGYTFQCPGEGCMRPPFVFYKSVGVLPDGQHLVQVESSGGGTGVFSDVRLVKVEGDALKQTVLTGGDRCNGGIAGVEVKGKNYFYKQNITPYDLVEISGGNRAGFEAYNDLAACAVCCVGTADYENGVLKGVTLTAGSVEDAQGEGYNPADTCFYGVYNDIVRAGNDALDVEALHEFGKQFEGRCSELKTQQTAKTQP